MSSSSTFTGTSFLFVIGLIVTDVILSVSTAAPMRHLNETSLHHSRYVMATPGPTTAQHNPLKIVIPRVTFKNNVNTVGQAITELLRGTGFKLARFHPDKRVEAMLKNRLPTIHRNMGPLTLEQALKTLIGKPWLLSVDPVHRFVSYELPGNYGRSVNPKEANIRPKPKVHKKQIRKSARPVKQPVKPVKKIKFQKYDWKDIESLFEGHD